MRKHISVTAVFIACFLLQAFTQKKGEKVTYEFPTAMKPEVKTEYIKLCDKGQVLYQVNCAKCHNILFGKKEIIPDFAPEQLKGYELRVANAQHEENMPDELVTAEELGLISTFLLYKKKSGIAMNK